MMVYEFEARRIEKLGVVGIARRAGSDVAWTLPKQSHIEALVVLRHVAKELVTHGAR